MDTQYESQYIQYLIDNVYNIDTTILDSYFLNEIDFEMVIERVDTTKVKSYKNFVKSQKINGII